MAGEEKVYQVLDKRKVAKYCTQSSLTMSSYTSIINCKELLLNPCSLHLAQEKSLSVVRPKSLIVTLTYFVPTMCQALC